ncbi:uncharacterized protein LOC131947643 [Physella acuta]|uniref:uncharacterized protein LOC131947643 n=1 Tax=Physella acuta TaxID=109671 RepID=UPI0027DE4241|nr:uncharacterized protein LOC131947643 [Physella acuta]XP_059164866.1 uncharacterized protein LOC131947643 [Physella acuta]
MAGSRTGYTTDRRGSRSPRNQDPNRQQQRRASNLSDVYRSPQVYAGLLQSCNVTPWSSTRKCLLLTPAFAVQYLSTFVALFCIPNLDLMNLPGMLKAVPLACGGVVSIVMTTAGKVVVTRWYGERKLKARLILGCMTYFMVGAVLVVLANLERVIHVRSADLNQTTSQNSTSHPKLGKDPVLVCADRITYNQNISTLKASSNETYTVPVLTKAMVSVGYVIMSSSLTSGHYMLSSIAMSVTPAGGEGNIDLITTVTAALGGCSVSFLGVLDLASGPVTPHDSAHRLPTQIFMVCSLGIAFLIASTVCSVLACYSDVISRKCSSRQDDVSDDAPPPGDRRPTRTAQEIFDECAPLLGIPQAGSPYYTNAASGNALTYNPNEAEEFGTVSESNVLDDPYMPKPDLIKHQSFTSPTTALAAKSQSCIHFLKTHRHFFFAMVLVFWLNSACVTFEFTSSWLMAHVVYEADVDGLNAWKGTRVASAGLLIMYSALICVHLLHVKLNTHINWKKLALGASTLLTVVLLPLAITHNLIVYLVASCVLGGFKAFIADMPRLLTAHVVRSQIGFHTSTVTQLLIETPTTILYCVPALSLIVSSLLVPPLTSATKDDALSVYYSVANTILACLGLMIIL